MLTAADSISPGKTVSTVTAQKLNVETTNSMSQLMYLQGKNTGKESNYIDMKVVVCEAVTVSDPSF